MHTHDNKGKPLAPTPTFLTTEKAAKWLKQKDEEEGTDIAVTAAALANYRRANLVHLSPSFKRDDAGHVFYSTFSLEGWRQKKLHDFSHLHDAHKGPADVVPPKPKPDRSKDPNYALIRTSAGQKVYVYDPDGKMRGIRRTPNDPDHDFSLPHTVVHEDPETGEKHGFIVPAQTRRMPSDE